MPEPTPSELKDKKGQSSYISRCVKYVMNEDPKLGQNAALGRCYGMYKQHKKHKQSKGCADCEPCWEEYLKENTFNIEKFRADIDIS